MSWSRERFDQVLTELMEDYAIQLHGGDPANFLDVGGAATAENVTKAFKLFYEEYRYGYACAYSTVIFGILLVYGTWQNRVTKAYEGV